MEISLFYIPFGSNEEATSIGRLAIENRLAACTNIFPVQSVFPWEGKLQRDQEVVLILKTLPELKDKLRDFIDHAHSYSTPAILSWPVEVNESYGLWMVEVLKINDMRKSS